MSDQPVRDITRSGLRTLTNNILNRYSTPPVRNLIKRQAARWPKSYHEFTTLLNDHAHGRATLLDVQDALASLLEIRIILEDEQPAQQPVKKETNL